MKIIGLCGGSGSGKGAVCSAFKRLDIPCIDTDAVYRQLTGGDSPCLRALADEFGREIISADGSLDRKKLASLVFFGDDADNKRLKLNEITHKFILDECRTRINAYAEEGKALAVIDAPLLFESGFDRECDILVCVVADRNIRISRIMSRDGISEQEASRRIDSQLDDKVLISKCHYVIYNNSDISSLTSAVNRLAEDLLK